MRVRRLYASSVRPAAMKYEPSCGANGAAPGRVQVPSRRDDANVGYVAGSRIELVTTNVAP